MTKKISILTFLISIFFYNVQAQTSVREGNIRGTVIDSTSGNAMSYVTISLKSNSTQLPKSTLSKENGSFILEKIPEGKQEIIIISIGYKRTSVPVEIKSGETIDLGKISIASQGQNLKEVEITTEKALVKQEVDRISYDVQSDPESKFQNALDMLRKVPLISVDAEDNIQVKGSGNFKVLINGRPSSLVARSPKDVFKSMPASSIVKIEVITNPPAKYDADGLAGIINIITTQNMESGYNGSVGARYNFPWGPGMNASLTLKQGKFAMSGYYGNGYQDIPQTTFSSSRIGVNPQTQLLQNGTNKNLWFWHYMQSELSYEFDTLNLLTAEIGYNPGYGNQLSDQYSTLYNSGGLLDQSYHLQDKGNNSWSGLDLGLNFQHGFKKKKDQLLTLSYKYSPSFNENTNKVMVDQNLNYSFNPFEQQNKSGTKEHTYQMDYIHPVKNVDIEGGVKAILRNNFSDYELRNMDPTSGLYVPDSARSNEFNYQQDVYSFYNSYNVKLKDWGIRLGVRVEKTIVNADFKSTSTKVKQDYENIIPSIAIQRKFKDMSSVNFGYTQRIERPSIWQLNPFVSQNDPRFISTGNPDLKAVLTNNFEIGYSTFKKGTINLGANYSFANNTIQNVTFLDVDTVSKSTFQNVGKDRKVGLTGNIGYPINKKLNVNMNMMLSYLWIEGTFNNIFYTNEGFQGNIYAFASYMLPKEFRFRVNAGYYSPWIQLQGQSNNYVYTSFSMSKDFLDKKLTLSAHVSNPFQKFRSSIMDLKTADFVHYSDYRNFYRNYGFNVSYRFGKLQGSVKKNQRGISNDDVKGKSGGGQGG